jgi:integrase
MSDEAKAKPRYLVAKPQKGGHELFYWQPSASLTRAGFKTVSLSRDRAEAIKQAHALNVKVDQWRGGQPVFAKNTHGTIPWIIEQFKHSPKWQRLRPGSVNIYEGHFRRILRWSAQRGDPPMRTVTRRDAEQFWASMHDRIPAMAQQIITRCAQLWNYALDLDEDVVTRNPFQRLGLPQLPSRSQVWQPGQINAVVEMAISMGRPSIALATIIAINTAQRPSDIRALRWSQYDGRIITITQIKTGATVTIPVTEQLRDALAEAKLARTEAKVVAFDPDGLIVAHEKTGRALAREQLDHVFREICRAAGIPDTLQFRDLRRTATTHLAEAGCTPHQIASIGGWSVDTVARMMETYAPVNLTMAEAAIERLEAYRKKPLEG